MTSKPRTLTAIPAFPLPDYYLFPGTVAPLQIFEPRYCQMMNDLMDSPGRLVIVPYSLSGPQGENGPVLPELGTLVELLQHEKLEDGRWLTLVLALDRVTVTEVPSDRLYRKVYAELLQEPVGDQATGKIIQEQLIGALHERTAGQWEAPLALPTGRLADVLLHSLPLDPIRKGRAYRERDPVARAALAMAWHEMIGPGVEDTGAEDAGAS